MSIRRYVLAPLTAVILVAGLTFLWNYLTAHAPNDGVQFGINIGMCFLAVTLSMLVAAVAGK